MSEDSEPMTIVEVYGRGISSCGYCTKKDGSARPKTSRSIGLSSLRMSCSVYKRLLDRGWRRSGDYLYKPNLKDSCCPQYTIKLDALQFKLSKNQRKALNKWNRFLIYGDNGANSPTPKTPPPLVDLVHAADLSIQESRGRKPAHRFEVTLEPSSFTEEKYRLYLQYQESIHEDTENTRAGFKRFLVESAIRLEPIQFKNAPPHSYPLPTHYGSYHQMYRVDGVLVAIGVIDILPGCVSSVYFMYMPEWNAWSLGKISAIREATLAKELHDAGAEIVDSLYMGFYIHSCPKMKYKGEYAPSHLLDPESYTWHPLETCKPLLDKTKYATFNKAKTDEAEISQEDIRRVLSIILINETFQFVPLWTREIWANPRVRAELEEIIKSFGKGLRDDIIISI